MIARIPKTCLAPVRQSNAEIPAFVSRARNSAVVLDEHDLHSWIHRAGLQPNKQPEHANTANEPHRSRLKIRDRPDHQRSRNERSTHDESDSESVARYTIGQVDRSKDRRNSTAKHQSNPEPAQRRRLMDQQPFDKRIFRPSRKRTHQSTTERSTPADPGLHFLPSPPRTPRKIMQNPVPANDKNPSRQISPTVAPCDQENAMSDTPSSIVNEPRMYIAKRNMNLSLPRRAHGKITIASPYEKNRYPSRTACAYTARTRSTPSTPSPSSAAATIAISVDRGR